MSSTPVNSKRKSIEVSKRRKKSTMQQENTCPDQEKEPIGVDVDMNSLFESIMHNNEPFCSVELLLCIEGHRVVDDGWVFLCQFTNKTKQIWVHERELKRSSVDHVMYYLKKHIPVIQN